MAALASEPTVAMTVAPRLLHHCTRIWPTPPAAAWTRTTSPGFTWKHRRTRNSAVMPLSRTAAAVSRLTPSGTFTARSAGTTAASL
jgi:hypothetical protein